jgi:hypothetical protein
MPGVDGIPKVRSSDPTVMKLVRVSKRNVY